MEVGQELSVYIMNIVFMSVKWMNSPKNRWIKLCNTNSYLSTGQYISGKQN